MHPLRGIICALQVLLGGINKSLELIFSSEFVRSLHSNFVFLVYAGIAEIPVVTFVNGRRIWWCHD